MDFQEALSPLHKTPDRALRKRTQNSSGGIEPGNGDRLAALDAPIGTPHAHRGVERNRAPSERSHSSLPIPFCLAAFAKFSPVDAIQIAHGSLLRPVTRTAKE